MGDWKVKQRCYAPLQVTGAQSSRGCSKKLHEIHLKIVHQKDETLSTRSPPVSPVFPRGLFMTLHFQDSEQLSGFPEGILRDSRREGAGQKA